MTIGKQLKELVRPFVSHKAINPVLLALLRILQPLIPDKWLVRVPVYGVATSSLSNSKTLSFYAEADDPIVPGLMFRGMESYEPETMNIFRVLGAKASVIFDIGANTGIYTIAAAAENPTSTVHAFEPVPRILKRLKKNTQLNKLSNVRLNSIALANFIGTTTLYIPIGNMPTSSSTKKGHRKAVEKIEVPTDTLDNYSQRYEVTQIDLIKIDTETTEPKVLEGGLKVLQANKPSIVCEVLNSNIGNELKSILNTYGYRYFWLTDDGLIEKSEIENGPPYNFLNYLFIHPSRMNDIAGLNLEVLSR